MWTRRIKIELGGFSACRGCAFDDSEDFLALSLRVPDPAYKDNNCRASSKDKVKPYPFGNNLTPLLLLGKEVEKAGREKGCHECSGEEQEGHYRDDTHVGAILLGQYCNIPRIFSHVFHCGVLT